MLAGKLTGGGGAPKIYVDDVFSTYLYTGNGSTQTINNGIDLAGKGGLVWIKNRDQSSGVSHCLFDSSRGSNNLLMTNTTGAQLSQANSLTSFNSNGFSLGADGVGGNVNTNTLSQTSWTFRKAPKFFDVVTFTKTSGAMVVPHNLGQVPGMVIIKDTANAEHWNVWHRSVTAGTWLRLNSTSGATDFIGNGGVTLFGDNVSWKSPDAQNIYLGSNLNNSTQVAYLFAHDTSTDGIIQCGSFTDAGTIEQTLGWEPQFLLIKNASNVQDWWMLDTMRGDSISQIKALLPNKSNAESDVSNWFPYPTATGFKTTSGSLYQVGDKFIYIAIRRPNKPPTTGTQVYNAIARTGTGADNTAISGSGFPVDLAIVKNRVAVTDFVLGDRLRGGNRALFSNQTSAESTNISLIQKFDSMSGITVGTESSVNGGSDGLINHFFRRAPGVFDVVCYTGTGSARTVAHNLGAVPELMIVKSRNNADVWAVYVASLGPTKMLNLNSTGAAGNLGNIYWNSTAPSYSVFTVGTDSAVNVNNWTYVAYLFATKAGISKVGSYTGNGSSQTIDCGFTTGARFVMIKRTDAASNWFVMDSARGIRAADDPVLILNGTNVEYTGYDVVDPDNSGFIVNQEAGFSMNVNGATYIFLAFA